ncbi:RluA family pseudouridine synthase [Patescibacteria group bacterium]|nr:RluA family pseudouridine synthase [Patescibacteria group bacterium]
MNIEIIKETKDYIIINKPSGLTVHKANEKYPEATLVDFLIEKYPEIENIGESELRPGIVHRLDKNTSGLMIIARTQEGFLYFKNLFKDRKIIKKYLALVHGNIYSDLTIENKIGRSKTNKSKFCVTDNDKAKEAVTKIKVVQNYKKFCLIEAAIKTGRTHQIRIHAQSISRYIAGDNVYKPKSIKIPNKLNRLFLHSYYLEFIDIYGDKQKIKIELPEELKNFLKTLENG